MTFFQKLFRRVQRDSSSSAHAPLLTDALSDDNSPPSSQLNEKLSPSVVFAPLSLIRLDPREDICAYKIVSFSSTKSSKDNFNVQALLHLQIFGKSKIYRSFDGERGLVVPARDGLDQNTKYCTDLLRVVGVQFFGDAASVKKALLAYQKSRGYLVSQWSGSNTFEYELEREHFEPRAGKPGCGCSHGLHFFTSPIAALDHYGALPSRNSAPVISMRLTRGRATSSDLQECDGLVIGYKNPVACEKVYTAHELHCEMYDICFRRDDDENSAKSKTQKARLMSFTTVALKFYIDGIDDGTASSSSTAFSSSSSSTVVNRFSRPLGHRSADAKEKECPFCFEQMTSFTITLQCGHQFHKACLLSFLVSKQSCPICKSPVDKETFEKISFQANKTKTD